MAKHRLARVNEQLKRELTEILRHEVKDPRVGMVTVTDVSAAPDLSFARVFVSIMGEDGEREESLKGLTAAAPFVRGSLSKRMQVRRVPELRFELDTSLDYALRIERLLQEVKADTASEPDTPIVPDADEDDDTRA